MNNNNNNNNNIYYIHNTINFYNIFYYITKLKIIL